MNISDLTYLLNKPETINEKQTIALENVVLQFPYFQAARALHLKGLFNQDSFRYNYELKKTAAYTTDRTILFEFITSDNFTAIQQEKIDAIQKSLLDIEVHHVEEVIELPQIETIFIEEEKVEQDKMESETEIILSLFPILSTSAIGSLIEDITVLISNTQSPP